jgi:hypothetical protein
MYLASMLGHIKLRGNVLDGPMYHGAAIALFPVAVTPLEVLAVGVEVAAEAAPDAPPVDGIPSSGLSYSDRQIGLRSPARRWHHGGGQRACPKPDTLLYMLR